VQAPEISVVLPTYNRSGEFGHVHLLKECVSSLIAQDVEVPFEILIGTELPQPNWTHLRPFLEGLTVTHSNVKVLVQHHQDKTGHGPIDNDLYGLARGKYVTRPLGDDEVFETSMLRKLHEALEASAWNILAYGDFVDIDLHGGLICERRRGEHSHERLMRECYIGICVMLHRDFWLTQLPAGWSPMLAAEDWDAWKRLSHRCEALNKEGNEFRFVHVPELLGRWRDWHGNLTTGVRAGDIEPGKVYE
jgi:hypothetical protein